jgi:poly-gamma-glutamate synthesis protein (capsule biosynthesis protein)
MVCLVVGLAIIVWVKPDRVSEIPNQVKESNSSDITIPQLTIEQIFDASVSAQSYPPEDMWTLIVTGDIIPARTVNYNTVQYNNFTWAFEPTASFLRSGDVTYANLEAPIISNCPLTNVGMIFCGDKRHIQGLLYAGIDVVNLANNHLGNHREDGIKETAHILKENNILFPGIENNPQYLPVKENKIAFLGYDDIEYQPGVSRVDELRIENEINEAQKNADLVIVQFHWGVEYVSQPTDRQRTLARLAIDSGADLVIGNHPHWIQPVEVYKGKLVTYAHGNFIFDQMWSEKTKEGVVGKYYFYKDTIVDVEYFPIYIQNFGQAHFITDSLHKERILREMYQESKFLQSQTDK